MNQIESRYEFSIFVNILPVWYAGDTDCLTINWRNDVQTSVDTVFLCRTQQAPRKGEKCKRKIIDEFLIEVSFVFLIVIVIVSQNDKVVGLRIPLNQEKAPTEDCFDQVSERDLFANRRRETLFGKNVTA